MLIISSKVANEKISYRIPELGHPFHQRKEFLDVPQSRAGLPVVKVS
jgi:hypothetical protein